MTSSLNRWVTCCTNVDGFWKTEALRFAQTRILKWKHAYVRQRREGQGDRAITLGAGRVEMDARPALDLKHQREPIPRCDILSIRTPSTSATGLLPRDFLRIMSSVYPGADTAPSLGRVLLGTLYRFVDRGIARFALWLALQRPSRAVREPSLSR